MLWQGLDFHKVTGPIDFSQLFISCSTDWSVKLWLNGKGVRADYFVLSFDSTNHRLGTHARCILLKRLASTSTTSRSGTGTSMHKSSLYCFSGQPRTQRCSPTLTDLDVLTSGTSMQTQRYAHRRPARS